MTMMMAMSLTLSLCSIGWAAGCGLFELQQFLQRRAAKRSQNQAQEQRR
jgi:hypothetical protein